MKMNVIVSHQRRSKTMKKVGIRVMIVRYFSLKISCTKSSIKSILAMIIKLKV